MQYVYSGWIPIRTWLGSRGKNVRHRMVLSPSIQNIPNNSISPNNAVIRLRRFTIASTSAKIASSNPPMLLYK